MIAAGIDLGGTKIETQVFDENWHAVGKHRVPTPTDYPTLVQAIRDQIEWATQAAGSTVPVGIGAAGLIHPDTGHALTANICAGGHPLPRDINTAVGRDITYINDCRALALSEAVFGAGKGHHTVMALILGTGVGGGIATNGTLHLGPTQTGGEFGHCSAPAGLIVQHGLGIERCGCGRLGCIETYIAGPGLERMAKTLTGATMTTHDIAAQRNGAAAPVWRAWCDITGDLLRNLTLTVDPDVIVLGGGLSNIDGVVNALTASATDAQIGDFGVPPLVLAQGGDASGARGAAYAAWQAAHD